MVTSAKVIKKVVNCTVEITLSDEEIKKLTEAVYFLKSQSGKTFHHSKVLELADAVLVAISFADQKT